MTPAGVENLRFLTDITNLSFVFPRSGEEPPHGDLLATGNSPFSKKRRFSILDFSSTYPPPGAGMVTMGPILLISVLCIENKSMMTANTLLVRMSVSALQTTAVGSRRLVHDLRWLFISMSITLFA